MIDSRQCRMARAALVLGVRDLAEQAEIGVTTISRFESGDNGYNVSTVERLKDFFEGRAIVFSSGKGWVSVKVTETDT